MSRSKLWRSARRPSSNSTSKGEWTNVKRAGAVLSAARICPTAKPYSADPNADS
jgi:hypothetical protein